MNRHFRATLLLFLLFFSFAILLYFLPIIHALSTVPPFVRSAHPTCVVAASCELKLETKVTGKQSAECVRGVAKEEWQT